MTFLKYLALPVLFAVFAVPAQAAQLVYQITGVGTTISFTLDEQPKLEPFQVEPNGFVIGKVKVQLNGVPLVRDIGIVSSTSSGGFIILDTNVDLVGPQLFDGTLAAPTLLKGNFQLNGFTKPSLSYNLQVVPAVTAVPEPTTWLVLLISFGLLGGAMRSRRTRGRVQST